MTAPFSLKTQEKMGCSPRRNEPPLTCFPMCVRESGASSSAKHQSNTQHQATLSAGAACFFVAPAGKRSSCKRESLVLGMLANLHCTSGRSTCIRLRCVPPFINRLKMVMIPLAALRASWHSMLRSRLTTTKVWHGWR